MAKDLSIYVFTYKKPSFDIIEDETHIPVQVGAFCTKDEPNVENNEAKNCNKKVSAIRAKKRKVLHRVNYNYHILS